MSWRENINLFLNRKFEFELDGERTMLTCFSVHYTKNKDCKLVARKISDMSDEEKEKWEELKTEHFESGTSIYGPDYTTESVDSFLYLLSIGVLPESFADEDVIWEGRT